MVLANSFFFPMRWRKVQDKYPLLSFKRKIPVLIESFSIYTAPKSAELTFSKRKMIQIKKALPVHAPGTFQRPVLINHLGERTLKMTTNTHSIMCPRLVVAFIILFK